MVGKQTTIKLLDKLYETGELRALMQLGVISPNAVTWRKVYHLHEERLNAGSAKMLAKLEVSDVHNLSLKSVYRILDHMNMTTEIEPQ